jgi:hypothetical protein
MSAINLGQVQPLPPRHMYSVITDRPVLRLPELRCQGFSAVVCEGLIESATGEWVVGGCWRCKALNIPEQGCEVIGARLSLADSSCMPQDPPRVLGQYMRGWALEAYLAAKKDHVNVRIRLDCRTRADHEYPTASAASQSRSPPTKRGVTREADRCTETQDRRDSLHREYEAAHTCRTVLTSFRTPLGEAAHLLGNGAALAPGHPLTTLTTSDEPFPRG